jgi:hemerythrin-like domain-containing protein
MLRDKSLIPLSRQHQHALALCVRLDRAIRAGELDLEAWQAEIQQQFESEIEIHFLAEEKELFLAAARFSEMQSLIDELLAEHTVLRDLFSRAATRNLNEQNLENLVGILVQHIRKEERQLFEGIQKVMKPQELSALGLALDTALKEAAPTCTLPREATQLQSKP